MGPLTEISLFSGVGGLDLSARLTGGFRTVCYVEYDPYAQGVLMSRIRGGQLDDAPIWDDVRSFDGRPWRGLVDCISGGFPCQDVSVAGLRSGIEGSRSGLWKEFYRIIREVRPRFIIVENVTGLLAWGGLGVVLGDLAKGGFDARWGVHGACSVGAPYTRERVFIVAKSHGQRCEGRPWEAVEMDKTTSHSHKRCDWWEGESRLARLAARIPFKMDRIRCCGNGVVPRQAVPVREAILRMAELL